MKNKKIKVLEDGVYKEYEVLFTFKRKSDNESFVVYTKSVQDLLDGKKVDVLSNVYDPVTYELKESLNTEEDLEMVKQMVRRRREFTLVIQLRVS